MALGAKEGKRRTSCSASQGEALKTPPERTNPKGSSRIASRSATHPAAASSSRAASSRIAVATSSPQGPRLFDDGGDGAHEAVLGDLGIDLRDEVPGPRHPEAREHEGREARRGPPPVRSTGHGLERAASEPVAAGFVAEDPAETAGPRRPPPCAAPVDDRARTRDQHDPGGVAHARREGHERVVDHEHAAGEADAPEDGFHGLPVRVPFGAGHPHADGRGHERTAKGGLVDHRAEHDLHFGLARRVEVGAPAPRLPHDLPALVREIADGLGPPGVDPEDVHGR